MFKELLLCTQMLGYCLVKGCVFVNALGCVCNIKYAIMHMTILTLHHIFLKICLPLMVVMVGLYEWIGGVG